MLSVKQEPTVSENTIFLDVIKHTRTRHFNMSTTRAGTNTRSVLNAIHDAS